MHEDAQLYEEQFVSDKYSDYLKKSKPLSVKENIKFRYRWILKDCREKFTKQLILRTYP